MIYLFFNTVIISTKTMGKVEFDYFLKIVSMYKYHFYAW